MIKWLIAVLAAGAVAPTAAVAQAPLILGVQTHFAFTPAGTNAESFRSWMARSGFNSSRDEMFWWHVEDGSGALALRQGALATRNLWRSMPSPFSPLLTLDFGYQAHDGGGQPRSAPAVAAFARYAGFVVAQSAPLVRMVEVWNEWNLKSGARSEGGSQGDPEDYVRLAASTYEQLKAVEPGLDVLVGAIGDDLPDWPWLRRAANLGMLARADGLSVHLYNHCMGPRVGADELVGRLDLLRPIVDRAGRSSMPVYVTEVGWPTHAGNCAVNETDAAAHAVRFLLEASLRSWVRGVWFYEMQDGGDDPANPEHHFGLLRRDGTEKPAGCALRTLGAQIAGRPRAVLHAGRVTMARFANGRSDRWILWASSPPRAADALARVTSQAGLLARINPTPVCSLRQGSLTAQPDGRSAAVALPARAILVIDTPPDESLALEATR